MLSESTKKILVRISAVVGLGIVGVIHLADLDKILITPAQDRGPIISWLVEVLNFSWWFIGSAYFLGFVFAIFLVVVLNLQPVIIRMIRGQSNQPITPVSTTKIQPPNYEAWDQVNEFTLQQAAYLWAEVEPYCVSLQESNGRAWLTMLEDAAVNRADLKVKLTLDQEIKLRQGATVIDMNTRVSRDELEEFAIKRNLRPRFLFPKKDVFAIRHQLSFLRTEGVEIRNNAKNLESLNNTSITEVVKAVSEWIKKTHAWQDKVIKLLSQHDLADAEWFRTLDAVPPARTGYTVHTREFEKAFCEHDYRLVRLD